MASAVRGQNHIADGNTLPDFCHTQHFKEQMGEVFQNVHPNMAAVLGFDCAIMNLDDITISLAINEQQC